MPELMRQVWGLGWVCLGQWWHSWCSCLSCRSQPSDLPAQTCCYGDLWWWTVHSWSAPEQVEREQIMTGSWSSLVLATKLENSVPWPIGLLRTVSETKSLPDPIPCPCFRNTLPVGRTICSAGFDSVTCRTLTETCIEACTTYQYTKLLLSADVQCTV